MNEPLNNTSALVFVKNLSTWFVLNDKSEPIMWVNDHQEVAWFFACMLEVRANEPKQLVAVTKARTKTRQELAAA